MTCETSTSGGLPLNPIPEPSDPTPPPDGAEELDTPPGQGQEYPPDPPMPEE